MNLVNYEVNTLRLSIHFCLCARGVVTSIVSVYSRARRILEAAGSSFSCLYDVLSLFLLVIQLLVTLLFLLLVLTRVKEGESQASL